MLVTKDSILYNFTCMKCLCYSICMKLYGIGRSIEIERVVATRVWEQGNGGVTSNGYRVAFGGDEKVLELHSGDGCKYVRTL